MSARQNRPDDNPNLRPLIDASINAFVRLRPRTQLTVLAVVVVIGVIAWALYRRAPHAIDGTIVADSPHLMLGNPSNAVADPDSDDNYLMVKPYYALSYNGTKGTANWVSWCVVESDLGVAPRKSKFDTDFELPSDFYRVTEADYSGGGFDRGHLCPHGDRSANEQMSFATFVMSNMIPQAPNVNRKAWAHVEEYCRELVHHHDRLYITAGPVGKGGRGSNGSRETIGHEHVTVPSACWKVIVAIPDEGTNDPSQISSDARVLTIEMPNDNEAVGEEWAQYRTTPLQIEQQTGLHFFTRLNPVVAEALRQRLDGMPLPPPRSTIRPGKYESKEW